eukprot:TRINITY_DN10780_c0_g1_i1.p1 TRINITY_DN10780_c0_g1~~TRINITY_DN10780_c0_g1_i1.p1  ORF type:complete len:101 (-),score=23.81 TRINITY_DN10780_c0_g1_i1:54-356(-)
MFMEETAKTADESVLVEEYRKRISTLSEKLQQRERDFEESAARQKRTSGKKIGTQERQIKQFKKELESERAKYDSERDRFMDTVKTLRNQLKLSQEDQKE